MANDDFDNSHADKVALLVARELCPHPKARPLYLQVSTPKGRRFIRNASRCECGALLELRAP